VWPVRRVLYLVAPGADDSQLHPLLVSDPPSITRLTASRCSHVDNATTYSEMALRFTGAAGGD
jgi:hypothetical protein